MPELAGYTINNFAGGLSDEAGRGVPGAFKNGHNLNIHKKGSNSLSANQKLKQISPTEGGHKVTDLIIKFVPVSATKSYAFGNSGNIYKIVNETVTLVFTDGNGEILDADYFYGYLYWTTATKLGRCDETSADWDTDADKDWKTLTSYTKHPIFIVPKSDLMCIGNKRYVANLSAAEVWNNQALDLFYGWEIQCLTLIKPNLLIGAKNNKKAELFTWDLESASYDPVEGWEERDINAFLKAIGTTYLFTPTLLYWFNQGLVDRAKELPSEIKPGAIDIWKGKVLFGGDKGVYSYHKKNKNYPLALNIEYLISTGVSSDIEIGAILGKGEKFYVGWFDDSQEAGLKYGIDGIDVDNKANAVYEGLSFDAGQPFSEKIFRFIKLLLKPLPADCSIKVKYKMNEEDDWVKAYQVVEKEIVDEGEAFVTENGTKVVFVIEGLGEIYEVRVELYSSGNTTPEVITINSYFEGSNIY